MPNEVKAKVLFTHRELKPDWFSLSTFVVDAGQVGQYPWVGFKQLGHPGVLYDGELPSPGMWPSIDVRGHNITVELDLDAEVPLTAVFLGDAFREAAARFGIPVYRIPAASHIIPTGTLWFEPRDAACLRMNTWIMQAAHKVFIEQHAEKVHIADLMTYADWRNPLTLAAQWYATEGLPEDKEAVLKEQNQLFFHMHQDSDFALLIASKHHKTIREFREGYLETV